MSKATIYMEKNFERFTDELQQWLRVPSISALPEHKEDVRAAAEWVEKKLIGIGFQETTLIETAGHPMVYAEYRHDASQPTLLIYGHYDVQPADPLEEWLSPPFEPQIRDNNMYGRGASDDKGQVMLVLAALETLLATTGTLPINVRILLEGEEESGGAGIDQYVRQNGHKLAADAVLICDTHMVSTRQPSLINGLRGILYGEVVVFGAASDLHSGSYGGVAPNPLHALCLLFSRLKGEDGIINIPELMDVAEEVSDDEKTFFNDDPLGIERCLKKEMGVDRLVGDLRHAPLERLGIRPTFEVHGIRGGFVGEGAKTVIPASALAKVSMRLPAYLDTGEVFGWLEKAIVANMPKGYRVEVRNLHSGRGISVAADNPFIQAASDSLAHVYGTKPVFMREGGSIPVAALFDSILEVPVILMGFGLSDDGAHGPNEKFSMDQFRLGIEAVVDYLVRLGR
ncbi:dipeptidase [Desulfopila sp. IMCC35008]|uniref:dipeptidase n=1 Tax=Desulfopila sp. IMCC35008 TaxID=2653858 RepID=UPI0013D1B0F5|nr:dipeptidase [Desulfopila sp. IMCC35008]